MVDSTLSRMEEDAGRLGVPALKHYWARKTAARTGGGSLPANADSVRADRLLLAGLRLGIRETIEFLMTAGPSFEEFEAWVLAKNGGPFDASRIERLNNALRGGPGFALETILPQPVLSAADLASWDQNGYVVLKAAVTADACQVAIDAIFAHAGISIDVPSSWYSCSIWIPLAHHPALWANRNSQRIHTAFSQVWRRTDLWMDVDVCGVNPPVRPSYSFQGTPLHWDMTLAPPVQFSTQGMLYLTDTPADHGAFSCVPGFHRCLEQWLADLPAGADPREVARRELRATPIAGNAGDLILWHRALPHAATPNQGRLPRVVQYINMFPSHFEQNSLWR